MELLSQGFKVHSHSPVEGQGQENGLEAVSFNRLLLWIELKQLAPLVIKDMQDLFEPLARVPEQVRQCIWMFLKRRWAILILLSDLISLSRCWQVCWILAHWRSVSSMNWTREDVKVVPSKTFSNWHNSLESNPEWVERINRRSQAARLMMKETYRMIQMIKVVLLAKIINQRP